MGVCFAGEVLGVEFLKGCLDVFDIEHDNCRNPLVGVDLDDVNSLGLERVDRLITDEGSDMAQGEVPPAGRDGV